MGPCCNTLFCDIVSMSGRRHLSGLSFLLFVWSNLNNLSAVMIMLRDLLSPVTNAPKVHFLGGKMGSIRKDLFRNPRAAHPCAKRRCLIIIVLRTMFIVLSS